MVPKTQIAFKIAKVKETWDIIYNKTCLIKHSRVANLRPIMYWVRVWMLVVWQCTVWRKRIVTVTGLLRFIQLGITMCVENTINYNTAGLPDQTVYHFTSTFCCCCFCWYYSKDPSSVHPPHKLQLQSLPNWTGLSVMPLTPCPSECS